MRIKKIEIDNYRAFKHAVIDFDKFNCIIGKNDTGKSTILAALEWFFNPDKELNENDFAAAGFDWAEFDGPTYYDDITGDIEIAGTVKEYLLEDFCVSVDVYFCDVSIPERSEEYEFVFSKDFMSEDGTICIRKYMYHPYNRIYGSYGRTQMGYLIKKQYFEKLGKALSDYTFDELKLAYSEIGKDIDELCKELKAIEKGRKLGRGVSALAISSRIQEETNRIKQQICSELYDYFKRKGEKVIDEQWMLFENGDYPEIPFSLPLPEYKLYTSKTPLKDYLNDLFTPYNAGKVYKSIEDAKYRTAKKLSEYLGLDEKHDCLDYKKKEKIDLFTEDSLVFKQDDLPLSIPLENRGEGLQLKIKNAVFRLLTKIQTNNQITTLFAFEEPESHLHPSAQLEMYETIKALSENPNYQVIITTHSPYIVKELASNSDNNIIIVKREEGCNESTISHLEERVLPYVSMNEINYIAFDEPSIEYHVELFAYIQHKMAGSPDDVDKWLYNNCADRDNDYYFINPNTEDLIQDKKGGYQHAVKTLPYCVRNQIDHPHVKNQQYGNRDKIEESIVIMRKAIIENTSVCSRKKKMKK